MPATARTVPPLDALNGAEPPADVAGPSGQVYGGASFCCLRPHDLPRLLAILLVESRFFEPVVALCIVANVGVMAWNSPVDPPGTPKADVIAQCEVVFRWIFTAEMLIRMIAYGVFAHRQSYLRNAWCLLDFVVVSFAWLPALYPGFGNFTGLRTLRTVRPLRTLRFVPGMSTLITSLLGSLPQLGTVAGLCAFVFLVFGIVGEQLFQGALHYRCAPQAALEAVFVVPGGRRLKGGSSGGDFADVTFCHPAATRDAQAARAACPPGEACAYFWDNPPGHATSFDSVLEACMAIVQVRACACARA